MKTLYKLFLTTVILFSVVTKAQQTVIVDAATEWQNTGITINQGQSILFIANGSWSYDSDSIYFNFVGPEGNEWWHDAPQDFLVQDVNHFSLVGKIGENGIPFGIGKCSFIATVESGNLFLSMNDRPAGFYNNYGYMVVGIFTDIPVNIHLENGNSSPVTNIVLQNYPNPFNPSTTIEYQISVPDQINIVIYDINGQEVRNLINEYKTSGNYSEIWDGKNNYGTSVSSGTYFYQVKIGNFIQTKKMILLK